MISLNTSSSSSCLYIFVLHLLYYLTYYIVSNDFYLLPSGVGYLDIYNLVLYYNLTIVFLLNNE
jgi:hypothetical protein